MRRPGATAVHRRADLVRAGIDGSRIVQGMLPSDAQLAFRASRSGLLTTGQLGLAGFHRGTVLAWAQDGDAVREAHGVYRDAAVPPHPLLDLHLPLVYLAQRRRPGVPCSRLTGWGAVKAMSPAAVDRAFLPEVLVDGCQHPARYRDRFSITRAGDLADLPLEHVSGLDVVPAALALAALAADPSTADRDLRHAIDELRRTGWLDLTAAAARWGDSDAARWSAPRLLAAMDSGLLDCESEGERQLLRDVLARLTLWPDCQVVVVDRVRVDFLYRPAGLILEYHGKRVHDGRVDADSTRIFAIERLGYRVIVITKSMLRDPVSLATFIQQVLDDRLLRVRTGQLALPPLPPQPARPRPLGSAFVL